MPKQPLTVAEKQQRALLRRMAKSKGKELARQQTVLRENQSRELNQFRYVLEHAESQRDAQGNRTRVPGHDMRSHQAYNLAEAIRNVTSVVRASFGVDQPIEYNYDSSGSFSRLRAFTNLNKITLLINLGDFTDVSDDGIKKSIALLKGATYHEVAHCLWTNGWKDLDSRYTFPENTTWSTYFRAWNLLEDGRIETLLVSKSPIIKKYLLPMVYTVVMGSQGDATVTPKQIASALPFLVVRTYLPEGLRRSALRHGVAEGRDLSILREMHDLSRQYQRGTTWDEHLPIVLKFHELLTQWESADPMDGETFGAEAVGDHQSSEFDSSGGGAPIPVIIENPNDWKPEDFDQKSETKPADSQPGATGQEAEQTDGDNSNDGGSPSSKPSDEASSNIGSSGAGSSSSRDELSDYMNKRKITQEMEDAFSEAIEDSVSDNEFKEVSKQFNASMKRDVPKARIDGARHGVTEQAVIKANTIALGMVNALETLCMTPDPSWATRQPDGPLLDVEAFVTRDIGDDRFWVDRDGTGERGHDLAVSVLLDCSGSMEGHLLDLGVVAYAVRKACGHFDIPCTTTLFGSASATLWDAEDEPEVLYLPNMGGTSIGESLLDIPNQRHGKRRHLVVILTDGSWSDLNSVRPFLRDDEVSLIVGFNTSTHNLQRGADACVAIRDLIDFPSEVEKQIARFFV